MKHFLQHALVYTSFVFKGKIISLEIDLSIQMYKIYIQMYEQNVNCTIKLNKHFSFFKKRSFLSLYTCM